MSIFRKIHWKHCRYLNWLESKMILKFCPRKKAVYIKIKMIYKFIKKLKSEYD